jgi:hypothetical protein
MKFVLLTKHADLDGVPPASEWDPTEVQAHMAHLESINTELAGSGELVTMLAIADPSTAVVVRAGDAAAPKLDRGDSALGPDPLAGFQVVDVTSEQRAIEIAATVSAAPGPAGRPLAQPIEVRAVAGEFDTSTA